MWDQALAVEFGTTSIPATHMLDRIFDAEVPGMTKRFKDTLGPAIEKKAAQLAKKAAR